MPKTRFEHKTLIKLKEIRVVSSKCSWAVQMFIYLEINFDLQSVCKRHIIFVLANYQIFLDNKMYFSNTNTVLSTVTTYFTPLKKIIYFFFDKKKN